MLTYQIVHDIPGRMRIRYGRYAFSKNIEPSLCIIILKILVFCFLKDILSSGFYHYHFSVFLVLSWPVSTLKKDSIR